MHMWDTFDVEMNPDGLVESSNAILNPGVNIMDSISEATKNSKRWQEFSSSLGSEELENSFVLGDSQSSFRVSENSVKPPSVNTRLFQTPSHLYVQYEQAIDTAMQEVRSLKAGLRDEHWEDHNADQIVSSLFALSRACLESAELFVGRQEYEKGIQVRDEGNESLSPSDIAYEDPYQTQLPTLQQVITQFQEAKRIHEDMRENANSRQKEIKFKNGIYITPILDPFFQKLDNEAMISLDPFYTNYNSIEEFLQTTMSCPTHPFGKALLDYNEYFKKVFLCGKKDFTQKKMIDKMVNNIRVFVDALSEGIIRRYQYLDLHRWEWEVTRSVHNLVMRKLYRSVLPIYMIHNKDDSIDRKIASLSKYKHSPGSLGVQQRLCTVISQQGYRDAGIACDEHENWFASLKYLKEIPCLSTVDDKLQNIVSAINILCTSVESFYFDHIKTSVTLSADDVLSLFVYALIAAEIPCIYSQCRFMDHFIMDEASLGEEGYALATFDTALSAILAIDEALCD